MARIVKPLANRILVRKEAKKEQMQGGLYIPESATEKGATSIGDVLDVGIGIYNDKGEFVRPLNVKKGDKVIFGKYAGMEIVLGDESLLLMEEVDIIGEIVEV